MTQELLLFPDPAIESALKVFKEEIESTPKPSTGLHQLRPYQTDCVAGVMSSWDEYKNVLAVMATGGGKTIILSTIAQKSLPGRTLIIAHREELITQAVDKIKATTGINAEIEKAENRASRNASVVVGSVQTLQGGRLASWPKDHFSRLIIDEAHHALSDSYRAIIDHFTPAKVLGVTATPARGDKKNLGQVFEAVAYEIGLIDLIKLGYGKHLSLIRKMERHQNRGLSSTSFARHTTTTLALERIGTSTSSSTTARSHEFRI